MSSIVKTYDIQASPSCQHIPSVSYTVFGLKGDPSRRQKIRSLSLKGTPSIAGSITVGLPPPKKESSRKIGITEQTYYRWRKEYGGMRVEQAKRLRVMEKENARLKRLVAELSLDISILKELAEGNF